MHIEDNQVIFSSGRKFYAFSGIVSLYDDDKLVYGYDGDFAYLDNKWDFSIDESRMLTNEECIELAEHMIEQWSEFRWKYINAIPKGIEMNWIKKEKQKDKDEYKEIDWYYVEGYKCTCGFLMPATRAYPPWIPVPAVCPKCGEFFENFQRMALKAVVSEKRGWVNAIEKIHYEEKKNEHLS